MAGGVAMAMKDITDKQVVKAYNLVNSGLDKRYPYEILMEMTGQSEKVCYRAMERACDRDYIEFGVSLRTGWLTEKGEELLKEI